ncbi:FAD-dependent monooxygenase [Lichenicoccus sp.]|uniref:FAD-dependent monooxygenase n=1 Tax=Lichenicoccus sp. TaxID=2781899 RepID=UPI003D0F12AB
MQCDVIVVGLGPVGATVANLLGTAGLRTLVVERQHGIDPRPRAIAIDEDALRVWQRVGLLEPMLKHLHTRVSLHLRHRDRIFLSCALEGRGRQGLPGTSFFHQPRLEQTLREALPGCVQVLSGHSLSAIAQDAAGVTATLLREADGAAIEIRARALVGCDGGSSTTRKLLGIALPGQTLPEPWIDIQAHAADPEHNSGGDPAAQLDFSFIADPARPGAECLTPGGLRRWEFRLRRDEDPRQANTPAGIARLLVARGVDPATIEIVQSWVYVFHVRQAERFREGRVFLCGDAAHLMPPFAGQGLSSGIRDAGNLCWKLAAVLAGEAPDSLLDSYETERRPNIETVTRFSQHVGALVMVRHEPLANLRDAACRIAVRLPGLGHRIRHFHIKPEWVSGPGWFAAKRARRSPAGRLLCQPWVLTASGHRRRLDDLLGSGWSYLTWDDGDGMPAHLRRFGVRALRVFPRRHSWQELGADGVVECEDRLHAQFRAHRATGLLVRPDRFIYGSNRDDLAKALDLA